MAEKKFSQTDLVSRKEARSSKAHMIVNIAGVKNGRVPTSEFDPVIVKYNVATIDDVKELYDDGKTIVMQTTADGVGISVILSYYQEDSSGGVFVFNRMVDEGRTESYKLSSDGWSLTTQNFVPEAPEDGKEYARKNKSWHEVVGGGGGVVFPTSNYGLGDWNHRTGAQRDVILQKSFHGNREWLLDWRPYLVDYTTTEGEIRKTPSAQLKKNNWFRKIDGSYANVVGITGNQSLACNQQLYWDNAATNPISEDFYDSGLIFKPAVFWEYCKSHLSDINSAYNKNYKAAVEVKLYKANGTEMAYGSYTDDHIVAPWETTNNMLGVFIGRADDVYLIDQVVGDSGKEWKGLLSSPDEFDGIDASAYKLARTGMAPGPVTAKFINSKWVTRSFFFNYASGTTWESGNNMAASCNGENMSDGQTNYKYCNSFFNNGHYPWVGNWPYGGGSGKSDSSQSSEQYCPNAYTCQVYNRKNNAVAKNPFPFAEGGYHALNTFLNAMEIGYGTKDFFAADMFSAGVSSNYPCNSDETWKLNGGIRFVSGETTRYATWADNSNIDTGRRWSTVTNWYKPKFQCMEPQIAASLAAEMNLSPGESFTWNGGTWHYDNATPLDGYPIKNVADGEMNMRMYKLMSFSYNNITYEMNLVCGLIHGMNTSGDFVTYTQGGIELVVSPEEENSEHNDTEDVVDVYLQCDQTKWHTEDLEGSYSSSFWYKPNGQAFNFEGTYLKAGEGRMRSAYCRRRDSFTPIAKELYAHASKGDDTIAGSNSIGDCFFSNAKNDDFSVTGAGTGYRHRNAVRFRGAASHVACAPRCLLAHHRAAYVDVNTGCSAQVLLGGDN